MPYSWKFEDKKNRWQMWYIIVFSIVIGLVLWGFFTKQYWMSFVILLISWIGIYIENNSEDEIIVEVGELWIRVSESFYDYSKISGYTFIYEWEHAVMLRLQLIKKGIKAIDLFVDNTITQELKNILPQFIQENENEDLSLTDRLIRILKL